MTTSRPGRRQPYTAQGITRVRCFRCTNYASFQWQVCADGRLFRPLCSECDIELNVLVLKWMGDPDAEKKVEAYRHTIASRA